MSAVRRALAPALRGRARRLWGEMRVAARRARMRCAVRLVARRAAGLAGYGERGQATVEFALVTAGFLAMVVAAGALWRSFEGGLFVEHALAAASHHVQGAAPGTVADVFLY